ncbi:MAG: antibiotic biosynthesis monooxygenase [Xanthomonadaceae bacterium]|nr:antibiotic biosynthesis monooxygenase [Xanthomonadaceae bacterium]
MRTEGPGFAVLYRWRLRPGMEAAFVEAWTLLSRELMQKGSLGSRLHRGPDEVWYSYAQWPSAETRSLAFSIASSNPAASAVMQEAIAERLPEIVLESVSDLLVVPSRSKA